MNQFANVLTHIAGESLEEFFQRRIADPIGMNRAHWDWGDWGKLDGGVVNGEAFNNRGSPFAAAGQWQKALGDFTQAIKVRTDYSEALANRGHVNLELGKFADAITDYSRAVALRPDFAAAFYDRAEARYQMKDDCGAWEDIRQSRRLGATPRPELLRRPEAAYGQRE